MEPSETVVYGIHAVEELLKERLETIDHIYFDNAKRSSQIFNLMKTCRKERLAYNLVPLLRLNQIAGLDKHQGVVAVCSVRPYCSPEELAEKIAGKKAPFFVLAASIEDPGNLGAIIRSCVAFGVDALFLERRHTSPLSPAAAKSSAGMIEHLNILRPKNLEGIIRDYAALGFSVVGAHSGKGMAPDALYLAGPTIIILGGEHRGIPPYLEKLCTAFASIPIEKKAESLNVSAAGAVLLYESGRQRRAVLKSVRNLPA
jgi:23S rRNA (guanosine2251-2'-O)-methyltransferase